MNSHFQKIHSGYQSSVALVNGHSDFTKRRGGFCALCDATEADLRHPAFRGQTLLLHRLLGATQ